jgi:hypothetical protein
VAARKMRMAISLRLAARSFWIGLFFVIPGAIRALRGLEIVSCLRWQCSTVYFDSAEKQNSCVMGAGVEVETNPGTMSAVY